MKNSLFYRQCFDNTGGWLPMSPMTNPIKLGDYCQTRHGVVRPLGNIQQLRTMEDSLISQPMLLAPQDWQFSDGVKSLKVMQNQDWIEQTLAFEKSNSYLFYLKNPKAQYLLNWQAMQADLIIKLTQSKYAFRHIYVITAVAVGTDWASIMSGSSKAEMIISAELNTNINHIFHLLQHPSVRIKESENISYFEKQTKQDCYFFKAKKLVLSADKAEQVLTELFRKSSQNEEEDERGYLINCQQADLLDQIPAQAITLNNCLEYFTWQDLNKEDIEFLCPTL